MRAGARPWRPPAPPPRAAPMPARAPRSCWPRASRRVPRSRWRCTPRARAGTSAASRSRASTRRPSGAARPGSGSSCASPSRSPTSRSSACASSPPSAPCTARSTARSCSTSVSSASRSRTELAQALRSVLLDAGEAAALDVHGRIAAAVLVPLYVAHGELHAVFTRRREDLRRHPGEISFPGGRQDDDETDLRLTALREAEEEIGLPADAVELVGALQPTPTIATNYAVYPFVGLIEPGHAWKPSAAEVDEILELSVADLRAGYGRQRLLRRGVPFRTDVYVVDEQLIWGATARMLGDLLDRLP